MPLSTLFKKVFCSVPFQCTLLLLTLFSLSSAQAENSFSSSLAGTGSWTFTVEDLKSGSGLTWNKTPPRIVPEGSASKKSFGATMQGFFKKKNHSSLLIDSNPVPVRPDGSFAFKVPLDKTNTQFDVNTVDQDGNIQKTSIVVKFVPVPPLPSTTPPLKPSPSPTPLPSPVPLLKSPFPTRPTPTPQPRPVRSDYSSSIGAGFSSLSYAQTGLSTLHEYAMTGKVSVAFQPQPSPFNFSGSIFFTGIAFGSNSPTKTTLSFFGFNARVGYFVPAVRAPWRLNLAGGVYFSSANAKGGAESDANFGYSVSGIQFFPTLSRTFSRGDSAGMYLKIAPLSNGFAASLSSVEYAAGLSYHFVPNRQGRGYGVNLDYSTMKLVLSTLSVQSTSFSFGANYHF